MAQAGYCSGCGANVWLTKEGTCPAGHGAECISNVYEVPEAASAATTATVTTAPVAAAPVAGAPAQARTGWPTSAKVLVAVLAVLVVAAVIAVAFVVLRPRFVSPLPAGNPVASQTASSTPVEIEATTAAPTTTPAVSVVPLPSSQPPDPALHTPKFGSAERVAILDVLRVPVQKELRQRVVFKVAWMKVEDSFAFIDGQCVQPNGKQIDFNKTPYAAAAQAGGISDDASGLLRWQDGSWHLLTYNFGATDVEWIPWPAQYHAPKAIFPSLGQ